LKVFILGKEAKNDHTDDDNDELQSDDAVLAPSGVGAVLLLIESPET
jgi:hypothetical protein